MATKKVKIVLDMVGGRADNVSSCPAWCRAREGEVMDSKHGPASQHPLPWRLTHTGAGCAADMSKIGDVHGNVSCVRVLNDADGQTAAFIVRACNAHDELVAALEFCVANLEEVAAPMADELGKVTSMGSAIAKARAALARATGGDSCAP